MKRFLSLFLVICLLCSIVLPTSAADEGTEDFTTCSTNGCTLPEGHEEDCNVPITCQLDAACTLGYDHDGSCDVPPATCQLDAACTLGYDHDGSCNTPPTTCQEDPACTLGYNHEGDCSSEDGNSDGDILPDNTPAPANESDTNPSLPEGPYFVYWDNSNGDPAIPTPRTPYGVNVDSEYEVAIYFLQYGEDGSSSFTSISSYPGNFTVPDGVSLTKIDGQDRYKLFVGRPGEFIIPYTIDETPYNTLKVQAGSQNQGMNVQPLYAQFPGSDELHNSLTILQDEPVSVSLFFKDQENKIWKINGMVGTNVPDNSFRITNNNGTYTIVSSRTGNNFEIIYQTEPSVLYRLPVTVLEADRLVIQKTATNEQLYSFTGAVDDEIEITIHFGKPSEGLNPVTEGISVSSDGIQVTAVDEKPGTYTLKILEDGEHYLSYTVSEKDFRFPITGTAKLSGGSFFALEGNNGTPLFAADLVDNASKKIRFCYGSFGKYEIVNEDVIVTGPAVYNKDTETLSNNRQSGQSLVQYTDGNGVTHNFVVRCYSNFEESSNGWNREINWKSAVTIHYGSERIIAGFATTLDSATSISPEISFNSPRGDVLNKDIIFGALTLNSSNVVSGLASESFYNSVGNVHFSTLSYRKTNSTPGVCSITAKNDIPLENNITTSGIGFSAVKDAYFNASMLLTFDVVEGTQKNRYYCTVEAIYKNSPISVIDVDISDAAVLNTLLSNGTVLTNWAKTMGYAGGNLTLTLPAEPYNQIIVAQAVLPDGRLAIHGSTAKNGKQTTLPGLLSKGGLGEVMNITFSGNINGSNTPKMTYDLNNDGTAESFTCGVMVDYTSTYQPQFDLNTLMAYHPHYQGKTEEEAREMMANYAPNITGNNIANIGLVDGCTFEKLDYGTISNRTGFIGGGSANTFFNCTYGIYIDCTGMAENYPVYKTIQTDYIVNTFKGNEFPIYVKKLPRDLSPYYVRFHESWFHQNQHDFWVEDPSGNGNYYCYRNYYGKKPGRSGTEYDPSAAEVASPASITAKNGAVVVTNPCHVDENFTPFSGNNLWIFDTDDNQHTKIFASDAGNLQINAEAFDSLTDTLEIPLLTDDEKVIATWTFGDSGN